MILGGESAHLLKAILGERLSWEFLAANTPSIWENECLGPEQRAWAIQHSIHDSLPIMPLRPTCFIQHVQHLQNSYWYPFLGEAYKRKFGGMDTALTNVAGLQVELKLKISLPHYPFQSSLTLSQLLC